jgi:L-arabonate dehydrase
VRTGDLVQLDVATRSLDLLVDEAELAERRSAWKPPPPVADRGWVRLYSEHVLQADSGADLDFLVGGGGSAVPRHSH